MSSQTHKHQQLSLTHILAHSFLLTLSLCHRAHTHAQQVRLHDLRALKPRKGQKLGDLPNMDKGIAFCTYDLLVRYVRAKE